MESEREKKKKNVYKKKKRNILGNEHVLIFLWWESFLYHFRNADDVRWC